MELKISDLRNESDVEQKLIYPVISRATPEGLGYNSPQILTKTSLKIESIEKGAKKKSYVPDYMLVASGLPYVVIEAKHPDEDLNEAAREAHLYANEVNLRYPTGVNPCKFCVVSNGHRTQLRRSDSNDLIVEVPFNEFVTCTDSFVKFVSCLSSAEASKVIAADLAAVIGSKKIRPLSRLGGTSSQADTMAENSFGTIISREFRDLLNPNDEESRSNIVKHAYVESRRKQRHVEDIDRLIRAARPPEIRKIKTIEDTTQPNELISQFGDFKKLSNEILLLIGNVGAGKSTFVDYLRLKALPKDVRDNTVWITIDLNNAPQSADKIYDWCQQKLIEQFGQLENNIDIASLEGLKKLFSTEVNNFAKGPGKLLEDNQQLYKEKLYEVLMSCLGDKMKHISCLERYFCTTRGKLLIITLDNCDKRNRDLQLLMFEVARWMQNELRALVILPIRDTTYDLHKNEPPLDASLKDLKFKIEPPLFQQVLTKRIDLILKSLAQSDEDLKYHIGGKAVVFKRQQLAKYLKGMLSSLFENERFARRVITGLAGWDMRKAMEIFIDLCRSGFVDEATIFANQVADQPFKLSEDEVIKILTRTHSLFFNGDQSRIKNIYQIDRDDMHPCQFIRYWILLWFYVRADKEGPGGVRGFHRYEDVLNEISSYGIEPDTVNREINYLCKASCLISESQDDETKALKRQELIGLTPAGHVHINISKSRSYLAACAEDAYILDPDTADVIIAELEKNRRRASITWTSTNVKAKSFSAYLLAQEAQWAKEQPSKQDLPVSGDSFEDVCIAASEEIERLQQNHAHRQEGNSAVSQNRPKEAPIKKGVRDARGRGGSA